MRLLFNRFNAFHCVCYNVIFNWFTTSNLQGSVCKCLEDEISALIFLGCNLLNKTTTENIKIQFKVTSLSMNLFLRFTKQNEINLTRLYYGVNFSVLRPRKYIILYRWYGWELMKVSTNIVLNREFRWKERKKDW